MNAIMKNSKINLDYKLTYWAATWSTLPVLYKCCEISQSHGTFLSCNHNRVKKKYESSAYQQYWAMQYYVLHLYVGLRIYNYSTSDRPCLDLSACKQYIVHLWVKCFALGGTEDMVYRELWLVISHTWTITNHSICQWNNGHFTKIYILWWLVKKSIPRTVPWGNSLLVYTLWWWYK